METLNKSYDYFVAALNAKLEKVLSGDRDKLAAKADLSRGYINDLVTGAKTAGYKAQTKIANAFDMDLSQFLNFGESLLSGNPEPAVNNVIYIPKVKAKPAAGHGSFEVSAEIDNLYAFRRDWLLKKGNPKDMVLMDVLGDSMHPYIMDGDTVMIDQAKLDLLPNKVYAVRVEDLIYLKYIDREPGRFILRSYNSSYVQINVETEFLSEHSFQILRRVIWWCHDEIL